MKPISRFIFAGGTTAFIYFSLIFLLKDVLHADKDLSVTTGYFISVCFHFAMNRSFVFDKPGIRGVGSHISGYVVLVCVNYLTTILLVNLLGIFGISVFISVLLATLITMLVTYVSMKKMIFR